MSLPNEPPRWESEFPIRLGDDAYATRREFTKFLGLTSFSFLLGTCWVSARQWMRKPGDKSTRLAVATEAEVAPGSSKLFQYPLTDGAAEPGILVRLASGKFTAFNQQCTHLSCPVYFSAAKSQLVCPCHNGLFNAEDGAVIAGPPRRALAKFRVELAEGKVWITGQEEPST